MSARSLNKVMLIGNLTKDPELRYTPSGTAVCSFRVATNRSWTPADGGERKEETEFHRIVAWSKLAELCSQLLTKGRKVYVEGRLQTRSWESPEGDKRYATEVVAEDMVVLDSRRAEGDKSEFEAKDERGAETPAEETVMETKKEEVKVGEKGSKKTSKTAEQKPQTPDKGEEQKEEDEKEIDIDDIPF